MLLSGYPKASPFLPTAWTLGNGSVTGRLIRQGTLYFYRVSLDRYSVAGGTVLRVVQSRKLAPWVPTEIVSTELCDAQSAVTVSEYLFGSTGKKGAKIYLRYDNKRQVCNPRLHASTVQTPQTSMGLSIDL